MTTQESREIYDQLEVAKETLNRLRCINSLVSTCCTDNDIKCNGCSKNSGHDVTIGRCSDRDAKVSRDAYNLKKRGSCVENGVFHAPNMRNPEMSTSHADLEGLHHQINSLEENVKGPILGYVQRMEQRNIDLSEAVENIRQQLLRHERVCPVSSGTFVRSSPERTSNPGDVIGVVPKTRRETRVSEMEKELECYKEKLERSETRVKELFKSLSQKQQSGKTDNFLEIQLQRQQKLSENYFRESTDKDKEISFLTIEKYNLASEVKSLVTDLELSNEKRRELSEENKQLERVLEECRTRLGSLEEQLKEARAEKKRVKMKFRGVLQEERVRGEKEAQNQNSQQKQLKELQKKCQKYEDYRSSQKSVVHRLESARDELLTKARNLSNEYKSKLTECDKLRAENQRLMNEITKIHHQITLNKNHSDNSQNEIMKLQNELSEAKQTVQNLEGCLQQSRVIESRNEAEFAAFTHKENSLVVLVEKAEKERLVAANDLETTRQREAELKHEVVGLQERLDRTLVDVYELSEMSALGKNEVDITREKLREMKKINEELVLSKNDAVFQSEACQEELNDLRTSHEELVEKYGQSSADVKAYKRIICEKEELLKKAEQELTQLHKAKDEEVKELLKKDREIAFLKARVSSNERKNSRTPGGNDGLPGDSRGRDAEVYLERIVELENECKAQKMQIDDLSRKEYTSKKDAQKSENLKEELAKCEEQVEKMKRELSRSKQEVEDLREAEEQLTIVRDEKEKLRLEVTRLQTKAEEATELKQAFHAKEEEMKVLKRMSSEEMDLEGKLSRLKDRCREKDDEIEELHQKVIALQVKIKDFMQQNSAIEEEMRNVKDKHSFDLEEKEKLSQMLKNNENKQRKSEKDLQESKKRVEDLEKELSQMKRTMADIETERNNVKETRAKLAEKNENLAAEVLKLTEKVSDLEESARLAKDTQDLPEEASTPMDNISLENSLRLNRSGRASIAMERLEELEEENVQLLLKQQELEEELDAAEQHADELKNTLKAKRENVNELYLELDTVKGKLKWSEKARAELADEKELLQEACVSSKKKVEDMKIANERCMDEADEIEKALTAAEKKVQELEKKIEEVSSKCANSEGQLQSVSERLTRKEKELHVVETQVEEQRKLCDGYKTAAEKQESLLKKLRVEKTSVDDELIALKLEIAKKEGTYKSSKEKITEIQNRLYETEDNYTSKMNECKKLSRENERLKREISDLERKVSELQALKKTTMSVDVVKKSPNSSEYNTKLLYLNTALKTDNQNVEGLDTKLNSAQNKISTLEVALAKDLRKFSLQRTSSDTLRRGYSPGDSPGGRRPRSSSSMTSDTFEETVSPVDRIGASGDNKEPRDESGTSEKLMDGVSDQGLRQDKTIGVVVSPVDRKGVSGDNKEQRSEGDPQGTSSISKQGPQDKIIVTPDEKAEKTQGNSSNDIHGIKEMWSMLDDFPGLSESAVDPRSSEVTETAQESVSVQERSNETWSTYRDETILSAYDIKSTSNHTRGVSDNHHTENNGGDSVYPGLVDFFHGDNDQALSRTTVTNTESALFELDPFLTKTPQEEPPSHDGDIDGNNYTGGDNIDGSRNGGNHEDGGESSGQVFPVIEKVTCTNYVMCGDQNAALPNDNEEMIYF